MSSPFGAAAQPNPFGPDPHQEEQMDETYTTVFNRPAGAFGETDLAARTPVTPVTGPWPFVVAAFGCAVVAFGLAIAAPTVGGTATDSMFHYLAISGWVLGGIVSFILLGLHFGANNRRQAESYYIENTTQTLLARATLFFGSVAVIATAAEIALWLSKTIGN